jgi:hypothetical protein
LFLRVYKTVLRIRDVYPGSRIRLFSIPDPGSELFPSRIRIKEFDYFNPKKWFLSSRKYDPSCSSRIRILTFYPSRIPEALDPGSRSATLVSDGLFCDQGGEDQEGPGHQQAGRDDDEEGPSGKNLNIEPSDFADPDPYSEFRSGSVF